MFKIHFHNYRSNYFLLLRSSLILAFLLTTIFSSEDIAYADIYGDLGISTEHTNWTEANGQPSAFQNCVGIYHSIQGWITDEATGEPIIGTSVSISSISSTTIGTDNYGHFIFTNIPKNSCYQLSASAPGYILRATAESSGVLTTDATVNFVGQRIINDSVTEVTSESTVNTSFYEVLTTVPNNYPDYYPTVTTGIEPEIYSTPTPTPTPSLLISGQIVQGDSFGGVSGVGGLNVQLLDLWNSGISAITTTTNAEGYFTFNIENPSYYQIIATANGTSISTYSSNYHYCWTQFDSAYCYAYIYQDTTNFYFYLPAVVETYPTTNETTDSGYSTIEWIDENPTPTPTPCIEQSIYPPYESPDDSIEYFDPNSIDYTDTHTEPDVVVSDEESSLPNENESEETTTGTESESDIEEETEENDQIVDSLQTLISTIGATDGTCSIDYTESTYNVSANSSWDTAADGFYFTAEASSGDISTPEAASAEAARLIALGKYREAIAVLESQLSKINGNAKYLQQLADAYLRLLHDNPTAEEYKRFSARLAIIRPNCPLPPAPGNTTKATTTTTTTTQAVTTSTLAAPNCAANEIQTANFCVKYEPGQKEVAQKAAEEAEKIRTELFAKLGQSNPAPWNPRIPLNLVVKPGQGTVTGGNTEFKKPGSVKGAIITVEYQQNPTDPYYFLKTVLRHEIAHAVFVSVFEFFPPRWLDEGFAVFVESKSSFQGHWARWANRQKRFTASQLMRLTDYPGQGDLSEFYELSTIIVNYLISQHGGMEKFIEFIKALKANNGDYEAALKSVYGFNSIDAFELAFKKYVESYLSRNTCPVQ